MGTNKRYAERVDQAMDERIIERFVQTAGPLQSLTPEELQLDRVPMTVYPAGVQAQVVAWVRFGPQHTQVRARVVRSTEKAAGIECAVRGTTYRCWVWGNAVTLA